MLRVGKIEKWSLTQESLHGLLATWQFLLKCLEGHAYYQQFCH